MRIGDLQLHAISDGTFLARRSYFGAAVDPAAHPELFGRAEAAWLPIGCFLIRAGHRVVLVDAGLGPELQELPDGMRLVGGQLPTGLRAIGVGSSDVTDVVCTHFHSDHVGWLFDADSRPVFPAATIWYGAADWDHFVTGPGDMAEHIRAGLVGHPSRLRPLDDDTAIGPGLTAVLTPGHTPGHLSLVLSAGPAAAPERAVLVGDAITCPVQLAEPRWHSIGDVDPARADQSRERLWAELAAERTVGTGAHFPELRFGRVIAGASRRWVD